MKAILESYRFFALLSSLVLLATLTSCGGGGGDGDDEYIGAARVQISSSPTTIDTGDRTKLTIKIDDVHEDGISLKIYYPDGLEYVPDSAVLEVDDDEINVDPTVNAVANSAVGSGSYLVFYFSQQIFGDSGKGVLTLELEAFDLVSEGSIGVDSDVDDPLIPNDVEFDINEPQFRAESEASIKVVN